MQKVTPFYAGLLTNKVHCKLQKKKVKKIEKSKTKISNYSVN